MAFVRLQNLPLRFYLLIGEKSFLYPQDLSVYLPSDEKKRAASLVPGRAPGHMHYTGENIKQHPSCEEGKQKM